MILAKKILSACQSAIHDLYGAALPEEDLTLQATRKGFAGSHTLVLFPLLKKLKKSPAILGDEIGTWLLQKSNLIASYEVVQGFLNVTLQDCLWLEALQESRNASLHLPQREKIIIEIACPNTNKPLHLGHLRNSFVGDAVANLLGAVGHEVKKIMHVNDRGIHICKSMLAYQQDSKAKEPAVVGVKGDHLVGNYYVAFDKQYKKEVTRLTEELGDKEEAKRQAPSMRAVQTMLQKWEEGNKATLALWKMMNSWVYVGFDETYKALNITFDKVYYESSTYLLGKEMVHEGLAKGLFYEKEDGSIWADLEEAGLGQKLLLRGDGTSVYITQDLGTADLREKDFGAKRSIYVVGNEQDYHFAALFAILKKLKRPYTEGLEHLSYGMVDLPTGKMKSREGTVVDADDLIEKMVGIAMEQTNALGKIDHFSSEEAEELHDTLAIGALKFFLLKVTPQKRMLFDPTQSIDFQGHTGPFIQYTYARITTMLAKAKKAGIAYKASPAADATLLPVEQTLIGLVVALRDVLHEAAAGLNPAIVAQYLYLLAKTYNQWYTQCSILNAPEKKLQGLRLHLSYCIQQVLLQVAEILGMKLPERM